MNNEKIMKKNGKTQKHQGLKMKTGGSVLVLTGILISLLVTCGCTDLTGTGSAADLTILVDDPDQAGSVRDLAAMYQNQTGKKVVVKEIDPDSGAGPGSLTGDLLVSDMSRIPVYAGAGVLSGLNARLDGGKTVNWTMFEVPPLLMAGEFPDHSGSIYALPFSSDALGVAYRIDLFDDPRIADSFCRTQGYPIGIPGTYDELSTLASFFSHEGSGVSGIGFAGVDGSDPCSSPWLSVVSSYGSGVLSSTDGNASGTWNSSDTWSGLLMLRNLSRSEPAGASGWGDREVIREFAAGNLAMAITWFSRFPELIDAAQEHNLSTGFFPLPGQVINGEAHRGITVRMDGIGIIARGSSDRSGEFLNWFYSPPVQMAWAVSGHQPSLIPVLDSHEYLSMNLYNRAFPESLRIGVTEARGLHAPEIRDICRETVRDFLSQSEETGISDNLSILDNSAGRIDLLLTT